MTRSSFLERLEGASRANVATASRRTSVTYPEQFSYSLRNSIGPSTAEQVADLLCRDGEVPVWIDLTLTGYDLNYSYFNIRYSSRFEIDERWLRYKSAGHPPFQLMMSTPWPESKIR